MLFKFTQCIDPCIINVPDNSYWKLSYRDEYYDDEYEYRDYILRLVFSNEEIELRDANHCAIAEDDRLFVHENDVGWMYRELIDVVAERLATTPDLKLIDIDSIENELYQKKFREQWSKYRK